MAEFIKMKSEFIRFVKYGFCGVASTSINYLLFFLFLYFHINYILCNVGSYVIAVVISYLLNDKLVFEGKKKSVAKVFKYIASRVFLIALECFFLLLCVEAVGVNVVIAKIVISFVLLIVSYFINKWMVYK